jgi:hypothetical protein
MPVPETFTNLSLPDSGTTPANQTGSEWSNRYAQIGQLTGLEALDGAAG